MSEVGTARNPMVIPPDEGRVYEMGRMRAIFKADCGESDGRYSVSEWWMEPRTRGPGVHFHEEDHVFHVIAGTLSVYVKDEWRHVAKGGYVVIPGGTPHTFENQGTERAGFISFTTPGGFEERMPEIAAAMAAEDLSL